MRADEYWTINGQPFARDYLANVRRTLLAGAASKLEFTAVGRPLDAPPLFEFGDPVIVHRNGEQWFVGRAIDPTLRSGAGQSAHQYAVADAWYDLERVFYQQDWRFATDETDPSGTPVLQTRPTASIVLFADLSGDLITARQQVEDALQYAIAAGVQLGIGVIDLEFQPWTVDVRAVTVAEVIRLALKLAPDAVPHFDYSTSPPTFHIRRRAGLVAKTFPRTSVSLPRVIEAQLAPRSDMVPTGVIIQYHRPDVVNGSTWNTIIEDVYPPGTVAGLGVLVLPVDLAGANVTILEQPVTVTPVNHTSADWWAARLPELKDGRISGLTISNATRQLPSDQYPNELVTGAVASWMKDEQGVTVATDEFTADASYSLVDGNGAAATVVKRRVTLRRNVTNAISRTYQTIGNFTPGQPKPNGLAQAYYESLATLQWEGSVVVQDIEAGAVVGLHNVLNITGAQPAWATMRAQIAQIIEDIDRAVTTINVGPPAHLTIGDLIELSTPARSRHSGSWFIKLTGQRAGAGTAELPSGNVLENSAGGVPPLARQVYVDPASPSSKVTVDSPAKLVKIEEPNKVLIAALADLPTGADARFRLLRPLVLDPSVSPNPDANGCLHAIVKTAYFIMTEPT